MSETLFVGFFFRPPLKVTALGLIRESRRVRGLFRVSFFLQVFTENHSMLWGKVFLFLSSPVVPGRVAWGRYNLTLLVCHALVMLYTL